MVLSHQTKSTGERIGKAKFSQCGLAAPAIVFLIMPNEIISYIEMCQREGASLQRGMNFRLDSRHSVILMSVRANAPYRDRFDDDGSTLIYEGHDASCTKELLFPKSADQPGLAPAESGTQNAKFYHAALAYRGNNAPPEKVRVYEKLQQGVWSFNGLFHLIDAWCEKEDGRNVFKFKLIAVEGDDVARVAESADLPRRRIIPTAVKVEVWRRDHGRCVLCGADDDLHFDHDVPYSIGGSSATPKNVQLLCARHNLSKGARLL